MSCKVKSDKLVSVIERGMMAINLGEKDSASFSDFGRFYIDANGVGVKAWSSEANSYCLLPIESGEEIGDGIGFSLSMPKLLSMLASLPKDSMVDIEFEDEKTEDFLGSLKFSSGKSFWKMPCLDPKLIADVDITDGDLAFSAERDSIIDAVSMVSFAGNLNDAFFTMCNLCISIRGGKIFFGATDEIRCACYVLDYPEGIEEKRFLIPIHSLNKVLKSFDKGKISIFSGKGFIRFSQGEHIVKMSLPGDADIARFPAFEPLVRKDLPFKLRVMTSRLKNMVLACSEMNKDESLLKFDNDNINFYAIDQIGGMSYKSSLPYSGDKVDVSIAICSSFLMEYLKKVKEETIQIEFLVNEGKPKFIKLQDSLGSHYIMKAMIDLISVPQS